MVELLLKALEKPRSKYLVYTSAGDNSNVVQWVRGPRSFDLWITYYGDHPPRLIEYGDYYNARKGAKYQNLHYVYQTWPALLETYSAIFLLDDDIIIRTSSINRLFKLREQFDYWVLQPAFTPWGKISHPITKVRRSCTRRHTNFVENGCALFRRDILDAFMKVYDPVLIGWGIDWWYLHVMGTDLRGRAAIIDAIPCINPHDGTKGTREIERLQATSKRKALWHQIRDKYQIDSEARGPIEYERFAKRPPAALFGVAREWIEDALSAVTAKVRRRVDRLLWRTREQRH
jgi:hypothetical protein